METRIGISGWRYTPWRGIFYPEELKQNQELYFASRQVDTIEINGTFYATQKPESYQKWHQDTPADFIFSVKGPRYITHIRRLKDIELPLANFFASGVLHLKEKLGPFLWQFPPNFVFDEQRLGSFFEKLPRTFKQATQLADMSDRLSPSYPLDLRKANRKIRHAIEVRHHSFENPYFIELLRRHNIALVFADTAGKWPYIEDITSDFLYLRLHGDEELYTSGYDDSTLHWWADRIELWKKGQAPANALTLTDQPAPTKKRDVFVYFDNDVKVRAPQDASTLSNMISHKRH